MNALYYLVDTLSTLVLVVFLLRLIMQLSRSDFRNPIAQAIVKITNPLLLPLRRILPPAGKIDTASVVAVLLVALVTVALTALVRGFALPGPITWVRETALEIIRAVLAIYFYAIFLYALLSLVAQDNRSPAQAILASICEPVLRPIRNLIPAIGGIDLSPLWACILIRALMFLL